MKWEVSRMIGMYMWTMSMWRITMKKIIVVKTTSSITDQVVGVRDVLNNLARGGLRLIQLGKWWLGESGRGHGAGMGLAA